MIVLTFLVCNIILFYSFPYGKKRILLQKQIQCEIVVDENTIKFQKKLQPVHGFVTATVIATNTDKPYLPIRVINEKKIEKVIIGLCQECIKKKNMSECTHRYEKRLLTVSCTVETLNYALRMNYCSLDSLLEIWVSLKNNLQYITYEIKLIHHRHLKNLDHYSNLTLKSCQN